MATKFIFANSTSWLKIGATTYYLTNLNLSENFDKIEVTDTSTTGDGKEYITGRAERNFTGDLFMNVSGSDPALNTPAVFQLSYEGKTYVGSGSLYTKNVVGAIDDAIKMTIEGSFNGAVTVTPKV